MPTEKPTLVVLPPVAGDAETLAVLGLERLGAGEVDVIDYPGHGGRARMPGMSFRALADEIAESRDDSFDVIGLAAGSYLAAELLVHHADRVNSALLACSPFARVTPQQRDADRERARSSADGMAPIVEPTLRRWFTPFAIAAGAPGVETARQRLLAMEPAVWTDFWLAIADRISLDETIAAAISAPVTIVAPLHDGGAGRRGAEAMHELMPSSRLLYIDGPHMASLECPADVLAAIDNHLEWVAAGGSGGADPLYLAGE